MTGPGLDSLGFPLRYGRDPSAAEGRLWERCVFVDWHGVLCDDVFWQSITHNPAHQQRRRLSAAVAMLFGERAELAARWMRGHVDAGFVISTFGPLEDRRCRVDYLHRRLVRDCRQMRPHTELLDALTTLPELTLVVIATDNMDCFSDSLPAIRSLRGCIDAVLCSSDLGVLKAESPDTFFGTWLEEHGLLPKQALLIDDSPRNCARFEEFGGTAIRFTNMPDALCDLDVWARDLPSGPRVRASGIPKAAASAGTVAS